MTRLLPTSTPPAPAPRAGYLVRGRIAPYFIERRAVSASEPAKYFPEARDAKAFERMLANGSIRRTADGRYWFDADAYDAADRAAVRRRQPWLIIGAVIIALLLMLAYRG